MSRCRLLVDIGGTNVRFARSEREGEIAAHRSYRIQDFDRFAAALKTYEADTGELNDCRDVAIGAAGPVINGRVTLTNGDWHLSEKDISASLGGVAVTLVNDVEAVALSLPHLTADDLLALGSIDAPEEASGTKLVLNVGTGFGAATLIPTQIGWQSCPSEAGHMSFAHHESSQSEVLSRCGAPRFTIEDALSGSGVQRLYQTLNADEENGTDTIQPEQVFTRAISDPVAAETVKHFSTWLGQVASDLALVTAAWGGVYLVGGIIEGWRPVAEPTGFRRSFEDNAKMKDRLASIYSGIILRKDAALLGLAFA